MTVKLVGSVVPVTAPAFIESQYGVTDAISEAIPTEALQHIGLLNRIHHGFIDAKCGGL